jgi:hypothetical protein
MFHQNLVDYILNPQYEYMVLIEKQKLLILENNYFTLSWQNFKICYFINLDIKRYT